MIKTFKWLGLAFCLFGAVAMADNKLTNLSKPILVKASRPLFDVVLKANPTTGYQWYLVPDKSDLSQIVPVDYSYEAPSTKLIGAPGKAVFKFRVKKQAVPSELFLAFVYACPWEMAGVKPQIIQVKVQ